MTPADLPALLGEDEGEGEGMTTCDRCGGRCRYDTSIDSAIWNVYFSQNDHLCAACILETLAEARASVVATLWGERFRGVTVVLGVVNTMPESGAQP